MSYNETSGEQISMKFDVHKFLQFISKWKLYLGLRNLLTLLLVLFFIGCNQQKTNPPSITSFTPPGGSVDGGTLVVILGRGFISGTSVSIGSSTCSIVSLTLSKITCLTAVNSSGTYDVTISTPSKKNTTLASAYIYLGTLKVMSVSANIGPTTGGSFVTITGTGFLNGAIATFGDLPCTSLIVVSSTTITCTTPTHAAGVVNVVVTNTDIQSDILAGAFTYKVAPTVFKIVPNTGSIAGGNPVTITGLGFQTDSTATFGGSPCTNLTIVSPTSLTCTTPVHAAGAVNVVVFSSNVQSSNGLAFAYQAAPVFVRMSPNAGALAGGTSVSISGAGFSVGATVTFDGLPCTSLEVLSSALITCTTPAHATEAVTIVITNTDAQSGNAVAAFTYQPAPTITDMVPNAGALGGGTSITITGTNFVAGAEVNFGAGPCTNLIVLNSTTIICTTPIQLITGSVNVIVRNADTQSGTLINGYTYNRTPVVTSVSPNSGPSASTTPVTINGTDFNTGATVNFDGTACTSVIVVNATKITCMAPTHVAGAVQVVVTNTDIQSGSLSSAYTYRGPPTVISVSANNGFIAGGTLVRITGTGFYTGSTLTFDGIACTSVIIVSASTITCSTPTHAAGAVTVAVTNADTQSGSLAAAYTYQAAPTVTNVVTSAGPLSGATTVTIMGTNFLNGATVTFGASNCTLPIVVSATSIQCTTPRHAAGTVAVTVTNSDTQSGTLTNAYIYLAAPIIASVSPNAGALGGATAITITGANFIAGATVSFGDSACTPVTVVSSTSITCTTTTNAPGEVNIVLTNPDAQIATLINGYSYQATPTVSSVAPNTGRLAGGTVVAITGTGFSNGATATFSGSACTALTVVDASTISCTTPANVAGPVTVVVTNIDTQSGNAAAAYTYQVAPTVTSVSPASGLAAGSTAVTITGSDFLAQATVNFGGSACTAITIISPTSITCTTAVHAAGAVIVTVTNTDAQSGSAAAYTYIGSPTITNVSPNNGVLAGGANLTITGTNFIAGATVSIGGSACTLLTVVSSTSITCTTNAHTAGVVDVVLINPDAQTVTLTNGYTYQAAPTVTSVALNAGRLAGGTVVTITGTNFITGATATFGGTTCTALTVVNATTITCTTPANVDGPVTVAVTNTDTQSGSAVTAFTYQKAPTVTSISPASGFAAGSTNVTITGSDFLALASVNFGGSACAAITIISSTSITCTTTVHAAGAVIVTVTNVDAQSGSAAAYTYIGAPTITSITPNSGSINGITPVTIIGTHFTAGATVTIGGTACSGVTVVSATSITCSAGVHSVGAADVVVTNTDTQLGTLVSGFTYQLIPVLTWQVGGASPTPPNPDSYGTTSTNETHTYTLKNTGDMTTSAVSIDITGASPAAWLFGTDNCSGTTLAVNATCTVQVTFLGQYLNLTTSFSGALDATAADGGISSNIMSGATP